MRGDFAKPSTGTAIAGGRCVLMHACVNDRYARRIDRFFAWNPSLANDYLAHPHFEVRAIAAKSADVFLLPPLLADPDEAVRWNAVLRLPRRYLLLLRNDPHREVRIRVASLLEGADLSPMMHDPDYCVRIKAARRILPEMLPAMMADEEAEVRRVVASRIDGDLLCHMAADVDAEVRLAAVRRLEPPSFAGSATIPIGACATRRQGGCRRPSCSRCRRTPTIWSAISCSRGSRKSSPQCPAATSWPSRRAQAGIFVKEVR